MKSFAFKWMLSLSLLVFVSTAPWAQTPAATVPAFEFYNFDNGAKFTDNDLVKNQLLFFCFFDVTCEHCRHAIATLNTTYEKFKGTALYLISLDDKRGVDAFLSHYGPQLPGKKNITFLHDQQNEFIYKFKPKKYPSMFLYSKQRTLLLYSNDENAIPDFLKKIAVAAK